MARDRPAACSLEAVLLRLANGSGDPEASWSTYDRCAETGAVPPSGTDLTEIAGRGLGDCGSAVIPSWLMDHWAPPLLREFLEGPDSCVLPNPRDNKDCTDSFIDAMIRSGCLEPSTLPANCGGLSSTRTL